MELAAALTGCNRHAEAYVTLSRVVRRFPEDAAIRRQLAGVCLLLGKHAEGGTWMALAAERDARRSLGLC